MSNDSCPPIKRSRSRPLRRSDVALTPLNICRDEIFKTLADLNCRYALLRRVSSAYESWRGQLMLAEKFLARQNAWPVRTTLRPGVELGPEVGLDGWQAERAYKGLLEGESTYLEHGAFLLQHNAGFCLSLSGDASAVFVAERFFPTAVEIGNPTHLSGPPVLV